jgi:hypothetical protein
LPNETKRAILRLVKLLEIEQEARALNQQERAVLVLSLIDTLSAPATEVSDDEVIRRDMELEDGTVVPLTHDEFVQGVQQSRRG